ncbi:MAG: hypothetical protein KDD35_05205, partial [Bdellovibrionales bacterium]|nr:hypothetical protein [Bdellovibrionales bacterium]
MKKTSFAYWIKLKAFSNLFKLTFFMGSLIVGLIVYQNCTNVKLSRPQVFTQAKLGGDFCSLPPSAAGENVNFIFVLDMSGSNLYRDGAINQGTDVEGLRFDVVDSFLEEECLEKYNNKRFAVVGFSDEILNLDQGMGCDGTALTEDINIVRDQIQTLREIQNKVIADNLPELDSRNPLSQTYYKKAFDCVNGIIEDQLKSQEEEDRKGFTYFNFLLTDGAPTDENSLGLNINLGNVDQAIQAFNTFFGPALDRFQELTNEIAGGGRIQPVLYGADRLNELKKRLAQGVLSEIANRGDSQVKSIDQIQELRLCDLLKSGLRQPYVVKKFGVINLTARMDRGYLKADSDMDGWVDEVEVSMGFDPTQRRSQVGGNEIIDSLCFGVSAQECQVRNNCGASNLLGINACDIEAFGLK